MCVCVCIYILKKEVRQCGIMFKSEIKNCKKLKPNGTFEFIDWDKNCDKKKKLRFKQKKDDIC